ncbi:hypothetical protein L228DRAFT_78020 [Xylona heveae TC161]|uniref:Uncharacterized protein n=1 Tax=Xylona heveae (strain CBS 132557 / TC161) TaxID=1328760 RepID=A0A165IXM5_XYLHT|nr:hypothetical protein L228DRAFT_78020 [Xylona heveae TC161]KZF25514.1 hypothetical protein L228DRAFT_78020 [Xylona heveae TC161]
MCRVESPAPVTYKCRHTKLIPQQPRVYMCDAADRRGFPCKTPEQTSKGSCHNRLFDCPNCMEKKKRDAKKDGKGPSSGVIGPISSKTGTSITIEA